jgi:iron complex outermembrane receptor protein
VWMASARFHLNQQAMLYARVATGYRPGGGCPTCGDPKLGIPGVVNPDNTTNYEAGFKGSFFDQRLQMDMAAFHIDWNHIQLNQLTPQGIVYAGNGGTAVSNGFELSAAYQFTEALRLNATIGYTNAHLTQDAPGADGKSGDQLPESPRLTGSVTTDYGLPLDGRETILFGAGYRYRDAIVNQFAHTPFASMGGSAPIGPQNIVDLYTGMAMQTLKLRLYARNVFNNQSYTGLLFINNPQEPRFVPVQPRTIGLSADYQF